LNRKAALFFVFTRSRMENWKPLLLQIAFMNAIPEAKGDPG